MKPHEPLWCGFIGLRRDPYKLIRFVALLGAAEQKIEEFNDFPYGPKKEPSLGLIRSDLTSSF